ncbi:MAG: DUF3341 domain-containing protein [Candidatus Hydrogenedentes bacterium]|nr:DUF3341 domain-containing protein [Candidatus Hydrogenedentota bacterium]
MSAHGHENDTPQVHGLIAEFDDPDTLLTATTKAHEAGYRAMDAYAPFPVHGLAEAMGVRKTSVSLVTLIGGFTGALTGFGMQYFASVMHYPYSIGGKQLNSWPAFMPITFELGILFAAFAALGSMLLFNGLPQHYHPIFNAKRFERASSDGFFLCIERTDAQYDTAQTKVFLEGLGPVEVSEVIE